MIPNRAKHLTRLLNVDEKGLIYFTVSSFVTIRVLPIFKSILTVVKTILDVCIEKGLEVERIGQRKRLEAIVLQ